MMQFLQDTGLLQIILTTLGIILTTLATWVATKITKFFDAKITDAKAREIVANIEKIVYDAVRAVYQTYVEGIKGTNAWTKEAQEKALKDALDMALAQLSADTKEFIQNTFGDIATYITNLIHSCLYDLKN
jgi:hypothetical protein